MGEVYRATDTKLERDVAIQVRSGIETGRLRSISESANYPLAAGVPTEVSRRPGGLG
jgi:hypothetical protein